MGWAVIYLLLELKQFDSKLVFMPMQINQTDLDRIIEMAWEDRTTFDAIQFQFGLSEAQVIEIMRNNLKLSSFKLWRKRVSGRQTKHAVLRNFKEGRHKCTRQRLISNNKISKR